MCVHVHRLIDKHSVYAHKATADTSLLDVRMPHHHHTGALKAPFTAQPEPQIGREEANIADTGVVCQKKIKAENYGENRSLFLSQGSNVHISSSSRPLSCVPGSMFFHAQIAEQPPALLETALPSISPFVHRSELFSVLLSFGTDI